MAIGLSLCEGDLAARASPAPLAHTYIQHLMSKRADSCSAGRDSKVCAIGTPVSRERAAGRASLWRRDAGRDVL